MDSRTQYEQWHLKEFGYAAVSIEAHQNKYFQDPVWMAWQEQDKRIAEQKEYYEMVMQDGGKRIAELEEKLKVASEALELAKVTFIANKMDVRNVMEVINKALDKMKG